MTNSSLSSLPIYTMGMYRLKEGIHHFPQKKEGIRQQMDSIKSNVFWQGANDKSKYHMVKREQLCIPKDFGGLGIMNTKIMSEALVGKWV